MECESCGMPMEKKEDFGGGKEGNRYCVHCTDAKGSLLPRETVRENMINFFMKMKQVGRGEAEKFVDSHMAEMPAWK